jgi:signal transduction histidine kinase
MSDLAAVSLGEWFLSDPSDRSIEGLVEILQVDPPFALWVACKADGVACQPPRSIADLATLLAEHGLVWLQWPEGSADDADPQRQEQLAARAAFAVLASELAGELAAPHGPRMAGEAKLLGLLHDPQQWLVIGQPAGSKRALPAPKRLAAGQFDPAAATAVEQAVHSISIRPASSDSPVPPGLGRKLSFPPEYLRRGLNAATRWATAHLAARRLPAITAKLARLAELERSFRESVEAEKLRGLAEFAAGAGHEINNPLTVIAGRAQLLLRDETQAERRHDLALINTQAMRVHEMIADLRLFATPPELERQSVDLTALVRQLVDDVRPLAAAQETALCLIEPPGSVTIEADPVQLLVAVRALCQNALEAVARRGRIEVAVTSLADEARITVADDGPGILPEQRPHIFEPFYSARQAGRGIGMGLSKCWRIVAQHGGRIEVRSGAGAVFQIGLPRSPVGQVCDR